MSKKVKKILTTVIPIFFLLVGLSVMLYPVISDWWNSKVQSRAIQGYHESVQQLDDKQTKKILEQAHKYNEQLNSLSRPFTDYDEIFGYEQTLDISGTGIMGYITIPAINSELVIYHGTSDEVLNVAAGHLQGTSLPVGGKSTHCVISAHRGLPSAKLFSELDKLVVGDTFTITILDEVLTYQVDKISIVEPDEINKLLVVPDKDYLTLMTCTPYGVNSHRLLVRAERTDTIVTPSINISSDAYPVDSLIIVPLISIPLLIGLFIIWGIAGKRKKRKKIDINDLK